MKWIVSSLVRQLMILVLVSPPGVRRRSEPVASLLLAIMVCTQLADPVGQASWPVGTLEIMRPRRLKSLPTGNSMLRQRPDRGSIIGGPALPPNPAPSGLFNPRQLSRTAGKCFRQHFRHNHDGVSATE